MLHYCSTMKTATVRDLRNHYTDVLKWISSGEAVQITRLGKPIARLIPEPVENTKSIDWTASPAYRRDRTLEKRLDAEEALNLVRESGGKW